MFQKRFRESLSAAINKSVASEAPKSFDVVGDIVVIKLPKALLPYKQNVAEALILTNKHIRTVLLQTSPVNGGLRLRKLAWIGGRRTSKTLYRENGCLFEVDLREAYFSPRLSYERMRVARQVRPEEIVVNMFAGVGCFSIVIAKNSQARKIFSIDINPNAWRYAKRNVLLNGVENRVKVLLGASERIVPSVLSGLADRILMPLPLLANQSLEAAVEGLKQGGGIIHYYTHIYAKKTENSVALAWAKVQCISCSGVSMNLLEGREVRSISPHQYQVVLDIQIQK